MCHWERENQLASLGFPAHMSTKGKAKILGRPAAQQPNHVRPDEKSVGPGSKKWEETTLEVPYHSFQGSESFQETIKNPGWKRIRFLKRTLVEQNGKGIKPHNTKT